MANGPRPPWWLEVDRAAELLASVLQAAAAQARRDGVYTAPPGVAPPRRRREAASLRHLEEVIRTHRLLPGRTADKDTIGKVLAGDPAQLTNAPLVIAVAQACALVAGAPFSAASALRLKAAVDRITDLTAQAHAADTRAARLMPVPRSTSHHAGAVTDGAAAADGPDPVRSARPGTPTAGSAGDNAGRRGAVILETVVVSRAARRRRALLAAVAAVLLIGATAIAVMALTDPGQPPRDRPVGATGSSSASDLPCRTGATGADIIDNPATVSADDAATRITPTLDFDAMNGSARYARHQGRTYYWGRAGSDDHAPHAGGTRVRWRPGDSAWRSCATPLPVQERDYVRSPAVATTIGGQAVQIQVCLWRDVPHRENCTAVI